MDQGWPCVEGHAGFCNGMAMLPSCNLVHTCRTSGPRRKGRSQSHLRPHRRFMSQSCIWQLLTVRMSHHKNQRGICLSLRTACHTCSMRLQIYDGTHCKSGTQRTHNCLTRIWLWSKVLKMQFTSYTNHIQFVRYSDALQNSNWMLHVVSINADLTFTHIWTVHQAPLTSLPRPKHLT